MEAFSRQMNGQAHVHRQTQTPVPAQRHWPSQGLGSLAPCHAQHHAAPSGRHRAHRAHRRQLLSSGLLLSSSILSPVARGISAACVEEAVLQPESPSGSHLNPPTYVTATGRVVAIGDLHGDWQKSIDAFRTAGVISIADGQVVWTGGDTVVVQLGDVMDRGDNEIAIVKLLRALDVQAREQGGAVYMINGNHESLNLCGDFRYVTPGAFVESALFAGLVESELRDWELLARVRLAVYKPGGPMAMELSKNSTVLVVNDTVFAHGGLLPVHAAYGIERLNNEVSAWMRADRTLEGGKASPPFLAMGDGSSVMWNRTLSKERFPSTYERFHACNALEQALHKVGAKRLVVGHTPQLGGANCECDNTVWRIDVGMSHGVLNRPAQVLEIRENEMGKTIARVLPTGSMNSSSFDEEMGDVDL